MDVSNFFTLTVPTEQKNTTVNALGGVKTMLPGQSFLDFILAQVGASEDNAKTQNSLLTSDNPVLSAEQKELGSGLDFTTTLAASDDIRDELKAWMLDPNTKLAQALALNQEALDAALGAVNDGIITSANVQAGSPRILQALLLNDDGSSKIDLSGLTNKDLSGAMEKLQAILTKLETLIENSGDGGLVVTNLTPQEMTDLRAKVEALMNQDVDEALTEDQKKKALEGIYLGLIKLVAPAEQSQVAALQTAVQKVQDDQANQVNNLTKPAPAKTATGAPATSSADATGTKQAARDEWIDGGIEDGTQTAKFGDALKEFSGSKKGNAFNIDMAMKTPGVKPDLSTLQGWPFNMEGSIFAPVNWSQVPYETIGGASPALSVTSLGSLTNLVTQAHSASQSHPAMQTIAATISKAAASGETKNIVLQLDPPELGRVEVRMSFGKDKTVKAVLLAEKPETLAMLQRDAHNLERMLFDSGLDAGGSSLNFELAGEGYNFNQQGQGGSNGYASKDDGVQEIIETKMTWNVDPETGHMRYSILV